MSELSDEEKKAIERIKNFGDSISCATYPPEAYIEMKDDIEEILYLIDNQQKEIEELKEKGTHITKETVEFVNSHYISKDKIKEKIEEYNKMINATYKDLTHYAVYRRDVCFEIKNVLQSLLEEE